MNDKLEGNGQLAEVALTLTDAQRHLIQKYPFRVQDWRPIHHVGWQLLFLLTAISSVWAIYRVNSNFLTKLVGVLLLILLCAVLRRFLFSETGLWVLAIGEDGLLVRAWSRCGGDRIDTTPGVVVRLPFSDIKSLSFGETRIYRQGMDKPRVTRWSKIVPSFDAQIQLHDTYRATIEWAREKRTPWTLLWPDLDGLRLPWHYSYLPGLTRAIVALRAFTSVTECPTEIIDVRDFRDKSEQAQRTDIRNLIALGYTHAASTLLLLEKGLTSEECQRYLQEIWTDPA